MEPPIYLNSKAEATMGIFFKYPFMASKASFSLLTFSAESILSLYVLVSLNFNQSFGILSSEISIVSMGSKKSSNLFLAPILIWWSHLGQTNKLDSSSGTYKILLQLLQLCHRPSGIVDFLVVPFLIKEGNIFSNQFAILNSILQKALLF